MGGNDQSPQLRSGALAARQGAGQALGPESSTIQGERQPETSASTSWMGFTPMTGPRPLWQMGESKQGAGARRGPNTVVQVFPERVWGQVSEFFWAPQTMLPGAGLPPPGGGAQFQFMHWCPGVPTWPPLFGHTFFWGLSIES